MKLKCQQCGCVTSREEAEETNRTPGWEPVQCPNCGSYGLEVADEA